MCKYEYRVHMWVTLLASGGRVEAIYATAVLLQAEDGFFPKVPGAGAG